MFEGLELLLGLPQLHLGGFSPLDQASNNVRLAALAAQLPRDLCSTPSVAVQQKLLFCQFSLEGLGACDGCHECCVQGHRQDTVSPVQSHRV